MPVHLLEITVRPDWQTLNQRMTIQRMRHWRATEAAVAAATMLAVIFGLIWGATPWIYLARTLLYTGVFWLFPLAFIYRSRLSEGRIEVQLADAVILLAVAAGVAFVSSPYLYQHAPGACPGIPGCSHPGDHLAVARPDRAAIS